jgi:hypothetical protein
MTDWKTYKNQYPWNCVPVTTYHKTVYKPVIKATVLSTDSTLDIRSIAYGNGTYVAVGGYATTNTPLVWTSSDCVKWTQRTTGLTNTFCGLSSVTFGNGIFVAVGASLVGYQWDYQWRRYRIVSFDGGVSWTEYYSDEGDLAKELQYIMCNFWQKNNTFYICALSGLIYSTDAISWSHMPYGRFPAYPQWSTYNCCFTTDMALFMPIWYNWRQHILTTDGINFIYTGAETGVFPSSSSYNGSKFIITGSSSPQIMAFDPVTYSLTILASAVLEYPNVCCASDGISVMLVDSYTGDITSSIGCWYSNEKFIFTKNSEGRYLRAVIASSDNKYFIAGGDQVVLKLELFHTEEEAFAYYNEGNKFTYSPSDEGGERTPVWDIKDHSSTPITSTHNLGCGYWWGVKKP